MPWKQCRNLCKLLCWSYFRLTSHYLDCNSSSHRIKLHYTTLHHTTVHHTTIHRTTTPHLTSPHHTTPQEGSTYHSIERYTSQSQRHRWLAQMCSRGTYALYLLYRYSYVLTSDSLLRLLLLSNFFRYFSYVVTVCAVPSISTLLLYIIYCSSSVVSNTALMLPFLLQFTTS